MNGSLKKPKAPRFENASDDEGFNDRKQSTFNSGAGDRFQQQYEFLAELRQTIRQTDGQVNIDGTPGVGNENIECVDARTGLVTNAFREELRTIAEKQLSRLELAATKSAHPDLFGLLRRRCEACEDSCSGYYPQNVVCPTALTEMDFPTFCQNCGCPACFHLVVESNDSLTKSLAETITSFNIRQQDINFNASLAIFEIRDQQKAAKNIANLTTLLQAEGLEVLSLETRALDAEEALFLRSRQLAIQEASLGEMVNQGFDADKKRKKEQIRGQGGAESIFSAATRNDLHLLDTVVNNQEASIWKKAQRYLQGNRKPQSQTVGNENTNIFNIMKQVQQRDNTFAGPALSNFDDTANISLDESVAQQHNNIQQTKLVQELQRGLQSQVEARKRAHTFKVSNKGKHVRKLSNAVSKISSAKKEQRTSMMTNKLINVMQQSVHISRLMGNHSLIITVSSTNQSNLEAKLQNEIIPSLAGLVSRDELFCSYISQNRIHALEDSVLFAPQLYRLQKSIVLSEPAANLFKPQRKHAKTNILNETDHGRVYTDSSQWYTDMQHLDDQMKAERRKLADLCAHKAGTTEAQEVQQAIEALEEKQRRMEARKPTVQTHLLDLGEHHASTLERTGMIMNMGGGAKKRVTGLNRALTASIRQRNQAKVDDFGQDQKEGGQAEQKQEVAVQPRKDTYWTSKDDDTNKMKKNYGTMLDFFDYSGVRVQGTARLADLEQPPSFGLQLKPDKEMRAIWNTKIRQGSQGITRSCNLFAVAKVGSPNMIFPSTLDVQMRNYQDHEQYHQLADLFFPSAAKSQFTVLIFRPLIVTNDMSDLFVEILKANDFLIIKRKRRQLTHPEASYLCKLEKVSEDNIELYFNTVLSGPSEIVVVSKVGAVQDAVTLCHGSQTGRRRKNVIDSETDGTRTNVDSLSAMFEIAPFSSFNEFVDLEDFLVQHVRLKKYKKQGKEDKGENEAQKQVIDALAIQKLEEIRLELSNFTRSFHMAAIAAPDEAESLKLMSLFTPRVAQLEDIILILNPLYPSQRIAAEELLVRMQYKFIKFKRVTLSAEEANSLLSDKYGNTEDGKRLIGRFENREVDMYHLTKLAGEREIRALFARSDVILEDYLFRNASITEAKGAFLPSSLPFLFFYMDSGIMHEKAMEILYGPKQVMFTSRDLLTTLNKKDIQHILETCLFTAIGDAILRVVYDEHGELVPRSNLKEINYYQHAALSGHNRVQIYENEHGRQEDAQFQPMLGQTAQDDSSIRYVVEGDSHTVYEIRFHKISHRGDVSVSSRFELDDVEIDEGEDRELVNTTQNRNTTATTQKQVRFEHDEEETKEQTSIQKEIFYFFEKFLTLNFYYKQVNKQLGGGVVPNFYRFKLCPQDGPELNRVYEVEEHMGRVFLEEVAEMQRAHARQLQHAKEARGRNQDLLSDISMIDRQQSLPAFILGSQIAKMCKKLEQVRCEDQTQLQGAGDIVYSHKQQALHGKVKHPYQYFLADKIRYRTMLNGMRRQWDLYLSVLETEIIESKLNFILESLTFRFTRQKELLSVVPDRITEFNLRLNSTVQVLDMDNQDNQYATRARKTDSKADKKRKFYKDVYADPDRAQNLRNVLDSVMHVVNQPEISTKNTKSDKKSKSKIEKNVWEEKPKGYSIHKTVGISGVEVAKRCKYQLIASILYLINFWLRKVNRRVELFSNSKQNAKETEEQYDAVLDAILQGIEKNYGDDEVNHVLDLVALRRGHDSKFEAVLRAKIQKQIDQQKLLARDKEVEARKRRNDPNLDVSELIKQQQEHTQIDDKNIFAQLKQFLRSRAGDDRQLTAGESSQFLTLLESTKVKLGANSGKLADEFVLKAQLQAEAKAAGRTGIQEKLSFVRMEYFLYGFADAHRIMKQLKKTQLLIDDYEDQLKRLEEEHAKVQNQFASLPPDRMGGSASNPYINKRPAQLKAEREECNKRIGNVKSMIKDRRYQMAKSETELLIVFRELMTYDIFVADHYFDGDRLTKQNNWGAENAPEEYLVPLKTFWLPISVDDPVIHPDSQEGQAFREIEPQYNNARMFQPESIKKANEDFENYQNLNRAQTQKSSSHIQSSSHMVTEHDTTMQSQGAKHDITTYSNAKSAISQRTGLTQQGVVPLKVTKESKLRYPEPRPERPEFLSFQKLENPSFKKEADQINELGQTLKQQIAPNEILFGKMGVTDAKVDPLNHLRYKVRSDELIIESIKTYMLDGASSSSAPALSKTECRQLAQQAITNMRIHSVNCEAFDELNFETSFRIYARDDVVEQNQLKNFVKSVAEL